VWVHYRVHLQDRSNQCVFRYDNAPHFPALPTFPHHKHTGPRETARAAYPPPLSALPTEVLRHVPARP
jgi:hypothetical protein